MIRILDSISTFATVRPLIGLCLTQKSVLVPRSSLSQSLRLAHDRTLEDMPNEESPSNQAIRSREKSKSKRIRLVTGAIKDKKRTKSSMEEKGRKSNDSSNDDVVIVWDKKMASSTSVEDAERQTTEQQNQVAGVLLNSQRWPPLTKLSSISKASQVDSKKTVQTSENRPAYPAQPDPPVALRTARNEGSVDRVWRDTQIYRSMQQKSAKFVPRQNQAVLSVMCYNVLADEHMLHHRNALYRDIGDSILAWAERYPRLKTHIVNMDCDILTLQEVQKEHYEMNFLPDLKRIGYTGLYKQRTGGKPDGCAIFFKTEQFQLRSSANVEYFQPEVACLNRDNVALVAVLEHKKLKRPQPFIVATTHLLYNPKRIDVRTAQLALLMAELNAIASHSPGSKENRLPCILTGDFNMCDDSSSFALIKEGSCFGFDRRGMSVLPAFLGIQDNCKHLEQPSNRIYNTGGMPNPMRNEIDMSKLTYSIGSGQFTQDFGWRSAYNYNTGNRCPDFVSTYHDRWVCVDYILYSLHSQQRMTRPLQLLSRLALPTERDITRNGIKSLPTAREPSDHFALVAKFLLTSQK